MNGINNLIRRDMRDMVSVSIMRGHREMTSPANQLESPHQELNHLVH